VTSGDAEPAPTLVLTNRALLQVLAGQEALNPEADATGAALVLSRLPAAVAAALRQRLATGAAGTPHGPLRDLGEHCFPEPSSGPRRWVHVRCFPVEPGLLGVTVEDVSSRRNAEVSLQEEKRFVESIVENIPHMIFVKDAAELRFVRFNRAGESLLGHSRERLIGQNDYDFFPKDEADFFTAKDRDVLQNGVLVDIPEEPIHTRTFGTRTLHTKKIPILDELGRPSHLLGISEDITERKTNAAHLARKSEELARSNQDLEQFAYVASHDLQEPLRKILAFGDRLRGSLGESIPPVATDSIDRMQRAAARMQTLINDLLAYSRIGTRAVERAQVDLNESASAALSNLETRLRDTGGEAKVGRLPVIEADPTQMVQLFQNLIGNALKFHQPGAPPKVEVLAYGEDRDLAAGSSWVIEVRDQGIGFDPDQVERMFQPFQRLHSRERYEGTGMGLAICRRIAERHGGRLQAESAPPQGTVFRVTLPRRLPPGRSGTGDPP
jgi:PAS domain S-box-containing protein